MMRFRQMLVAAALCAALAPSAFAQNEDTPPLPDPARPAVGDWTGHVSWNAPVVTYTWRLYPDGTFNSGRLGRDQSGGGAWSARGDHVTLKYSNGVRYEGDLNGDSYSGAVYTAHDRTFGSFTMARDVKLTGSKNDDEE